MPIGLGIAPLGDSIYGYGSVDQGIAPSSIFYVDPNTGEVCDAALIDPGLRDYVFDLNGNPSGMRGVYQLVQLAVQTVKNSSAIAGFGNDVTSIKTIDETTVRKIDDALRDALNALVQAKLITIEGVTTTRTGTSAMRPLLQFTDLTTNTEKELTL